MKTHLPTSKRQLKKLHAEWTSGALTAMLERHTAAGNNKAIAKVDKLITHAVEYDGMLTADADHKASLDSTRRDRKNKSDAAMTKRMGVPKDKYLAAKAK